MKTRTAGETKWAHLFFMPSVYGALTWGGALLLYKVHLLEWEVSNPYAMAIFVIAEGAFIVSAINFSPLYRRWLLGRAKRVNRAGRPAFLKTGISLLHLIGFIGLGKYVVDFSRNFGGINGFFLALVNQSYMIRWATEDTSSVGTQISYFGWIAISLTVLEVVRKRISRWWLLIAFVQFLGNLMYIDRTRPIWILFTALVSLLPNVEKFSFLKSIKWAVVATSAAVLLFLGIAEWVGKIADENTYGASVLPPAVQTVYAYATAGFPYFNRMIEADETVSYSPERTIYPALKVFSSIGITEPPPSQINEFYYLPFETNVGTFLEPFYRDGGILCVLLGILIYSFGIDAVGLQFLRGGTGIDFYVWANLCFVTFIGFFTPKIAAFPIWLFCGIGLAFSLGWRICLYLIECRLNREMIHLPHGS